MVFLAKNGALQRCELQFASLHHPIFDSKIPFLSSSFLVLTGPRCPESEISHSDVRAKFSGLSGLLLGRYTRVIRLSATPAGVVSRF